MKHKIDDKILYQRILENIFELMDKGEANLSKVELKRLAVMSAFAEKYEDEVLFNTPNQ